MSRSLRLAVFGLSLSSSWGNGHATTYRALLRAMASRGHELTFFERDQTWYVDNRDLANPDYCDLVFYNRLGDLEDHRERIASCDAVIVGSYTPEGVALGRLICRWRVGVTAFYDIDTPVTLAKLERGDFEYLAPDLIPRYDLYLSFTGGPTLRRLEDRYGSPAARVLHCAVDEHLYRPLDVTPRYDLGYLGTYSDDRQPTLQELLIEPARAAPERRFVVAGPLYPDHIDWPSNVERIEHIGPDRHAEFYASCRFTLNVTREEMRRAGYSPSVRLFEAAACGAPIISDPWAGLGDVFATGNEILIAKSGRDVLAALALDECARRQLGELGRRRTLAQHTAAHRAGELETHLEATLQRLSTMRADISETVRSRRGSLAGGPLSIGSRL